MIMLPNCVYTCILKLKQLGFITLICIYLGNLNVNKFQKAYIVITHGFFAQNINIFWVMIMFFWKKNEPKFAW
jgi:hypothetical protein